MEQFTLRIKKDDLEKIKAIAKEHKDVVKGVSYFDYHIVKYSTPTENTLWQVFSVYTVKEESYYITPSFGTNEEFKSWLDTMKKRSKFNFNTTVTTDDKILTLSSCYDTNGTRMVLHAKLIKKEAR